jgi:sialate O-acetylesterase
MAAIFGDHMVLQEGMKLPVWGTAAAGEAVTVTIGTDSAKVTAGADGKWRVDLAPLPVNAAPVTLTVAGTNTLTFQDVLVGEVWLCSGQSNMEFRVRQAHNAATVLPAATDPQLRLFFVKENTALDPLDDVTGQWKTCTPESAKEFTAVGYFFGRDLRQKLNRPVGLIASYWGGTRAEAWTSIAGLQKDPELHHYVASQEHVRSLFADAAAKYPAQQAAYQAKLDAFNKGPGPQEYADAMKKYWAANNALLAAGKPGVPMPPNPTPHPPTAPDGAQQTPGNLFNAMIAPLIPYAIKGVIWYQGESNANFAAEYRILFPRMITDWREHWGEGDFPFLFVQLARLQHGLVQNWAFQRESQFKALSLPNTGIATAIDIGNPIDVHPQDKEDVGHRLALVARHVAYGETLVFSGPRYAGMKVEGNAIRVSFTDVGSGLDLQVAPWVPNTTAPLPTDHLVGFMVAGADKNFVPAYAKIDGDTVVVSSPQVPTPVAVRYDFLNCPDGNLYNKEALPAFPFRSDDWPDAAAEGVVTTK